MTDTIKKIFTSYLPAILISSFFAVPLISPSNIYYGMFFGKEFGFYIFSSLLIIYGVLYYILDQPIRRIRTNKIDITFLLFVLWNLISAIISNDSYINGKTSELILLTFIYFIIKGQMVDPISSRTTLLVTSTSLLIIANIEVVIGILQLYDIFASKNPYFKVIGTFHNPAPYSLFLTIVFAFASTAYLFNVFKEKFIKYLSLGTCLSILNIIPFTANRSSWIGIFFSIVCIIFIKYDWRQLSHIFKKWVKFGLVVITLIFFITGINFLYNFKSGSTKGRLLVWEVSGNIIKEHPVIGIGYGRFKSEYNLYQAEYFRSTHNKDEELLADNVRSAYNDYIEILVETGIIGLLIFSTLIYFILKSLKLKEDNIYLSSIPLIICSILSLISYPLNTISTKILFIFFIGLLSAQISLHEPDLLSIYIRRYSLILLLIFLIPFAGYQVKRCSKYKQWLYADNAFSSHQTEISEVYYRQINKYLKYDLRFSQLFAESLFANEKYMETISLLNNVKDIVICLWNSCWMMISVA